ncbi:hypothetical protein V8E51_003639 [Hyaloscypha variabilis]
MFSPTTMKRFVEAMNTQNSDLVPNFVFPLNNQSSSSNPRKEAFKFRDGIVIVSTPILSEKNVYECLSNACKFFEVQPPVRWDIAHIIRGTTATESIENATKVAEVTKRNRRISDDAREAERKPESFSYFDLPMQIPPKKPVARSLSGNNGNGAKELIQQRSTGTLLVDRSPSHDIPTVEHIENRISPSSELGPATKASIEEVFVDGSDWQDRLVPSAKMENARKAYITKRIKQSNRTKIWDMEAEDEEEGGVNVAAGPMLLTRGGQKRSIRVRLPGSTFESWVPLPNLTTDSQARIDAWRMHVAEELGMVPHETNPSSRSTSMRLDISPASASTKNTASTRPGAEKRNRCKQDWRRPRDQVAANSSCKPWPTKILSRGSQLANNGELRESESKDREKSHDSPETANFSANKLDAIHGDSAIVLDKEYEASRAA